MTRAAMPNMPHTTLMVGGAPINELVIDQAVEWLTLLKSGEASESDKQRWQEWRATHPDHERAWKHIETALGQIQAMDSKAAYTALSPYAGTVTLDSPKRRAVIRSLVGVGAIGAASMLASRTPAFQQATADYQTGTGERREVALDDGSRITLNTSSAINVRFDSKRRTVRLVAGEIHIVTGHLTGLSDRPFFVETDAGTIRALGTRFAVRQHNEGFQVSVLESAVEITPNNGPNRQLILNTGQEAIFTSDDVGKVKSCDESTAAWMQDVIVATHMRLEDFLSELGRYRSGVLRCESNVADLRFSGVFPLGNTDQVLAMLPNVLPVKVQTRTRYWVTVTALE